MTTKELQQMKMEGETRYTIGYNEAIDAVISKLTMKGPIDEWVALWNDEDLWKGRQARNITAAKKKLPHCRKVNADIIKYYKRLIKDKYDIEDFKYALDKYIEEIISRDPTNDYALHRFDFKTFLKQENGLRKFVNY